MVLTNTSLKKMKAEKHLYWQNRPADECVNAVSELSLAAYAMKEPVADIQRLMKVIDGLKRSQRR